MTEPYRVYHHAKKCKAEHTERCEAECGEYVPKHEMDAEIARLTKKLEQAERTAKIDCDFLAQRLRIEEGVVARLTGELEEAKADAQEGRRHYDEWEKVCADKDAEIARLTKKLEQAERELLTETAGWTKEVMLHAITKYALARAERVCIALTTASRQAGHSGGFADGHMQELDEAVAAWLSARKEAE